MSLKKDRPRQVLFFRLVTTIILLSPSDKFKQAPTDLRLLLDSHPVSKCSSVLLLLSAVHTYTGMSRANGTTTISALTSSTSVAEEREERWPVYVTVAVSKQVHIFGGGELGWLVGYLTR